MRISLLDETRSHLGEGPVWDVREQALYWVDSLAPCIYRFGWDSRGTTRYDLPGTYVGSLAVRENGGLIVAMDDSFCTFDPGNGVCSEIASPLRGLENTRFNDGKVDRAGRFVAGGVNGLAGEATGPVMPPQPVAPMVSLHPDHTANEVLGRFLCFNGPCFSPEGSTLYVNGRGDMRMIESFPYDRTTGTVDEDGRRVIIQDINPDGTTVDAEGYLWSAQWDDACILRISPQGAINHRIDLEGQVVSSVMFGGPNLDVLFATTLGCPHWGTRPTAKNAGAVFVIEDIGYRGLAEPRFAG